MAHVKDTYYFPHDSNARNDPKIVAMRSMYENGYGWYWILIEMMREDVDYQLDYSKKFSLIAISKELGCTVDEVKQFIEDCIHEFELFETDGDHFWSPSLKNRMVKLDDTRARRSESAKSRWNKEKKTTTKKKKEKEKDDLFKDEEPKGLMDHPDVKDAFAGFKEMRVKIKKPMTKRAEDMAISKLIKLAGEDIVLAVNILNQSTFKSWQDLFPLKQDAESVSNNKPVIVL